MTELQHAAGSAPVEARMVSVGRQFMAPDERQSSRAGVRQKGAVADEQAAENHERFHEDISFPQLRPHVHGRQVTGLRHERTTDGYGAGFSLPLIKKLPEQIPVVVAALNR